MIMSEVKNKDEVIIIDRDIISEIVKDYDNYLDFLDKINKGENPLKDRDSKRFGGSVGSLMDASLLQPNQSLRIKLKEGGMTRDEEIAFHLFIVNMSPKGPSDAYAVEQSRDWLLKNLTPAEQRQMDFPR